MLGKLWRVKNNSVGNGVEGVIAKARFVFERGKRNLREGNGGELFERY